MKWDLKLTVGRLHQTAAVKGLAKAFYAEKNERHTFITFDVLRSLFTVDESNQARVGHNNYDS